MPTDSDGVLGRLRKGIKKRATKEKSKRAKREIQRRKRRAVREDVAGDIKDIAGASRAGEVVKGARRAGGAAVRGLERADKALAPGAGGLENEIAQGEINVGDLKTEIEFVSDRQSLRRLLRAERKGKNRSSAKSAIRTRLKELEDGADMDAGAETVGDFLGVSAPDEPMFGGDIGVGEPEMEPIFGEKSGGKKKKKGETDSFGLDF